MNLKEDEYLPLRDLVFQTLRESILKGDLQPGERLVETVLAEKLGVSRTPLREAVHKLEQEGLVTMTPRRGTRVASISAKTVHDVLEVRKAMEELACRLAVERITEDEKLRLKQAEDEFLIIADEKDLKKIADRDEAFHDVIYKATKNQKLQFLINNLREQMYRFRLECIKDETTRQHLVEEHRLIAEAILRKDAQAAMDEAARHIDNQEKTILKNLEGTGTHGKAENRQKQW